MYNNNLFFPFWPNNGCRNNPFCCPGCNRPFPPPPPPRPWPPGPPPPPPRPPRPPGPPCGHGPCIGNGPWIGRPFR